MSFSIKVKVESREDAGDEQTRIVFRPDYEDPANKEWAKYTPGLMLSMTVKDAVAENIVPGDCFTGVFTKEKDGGADAGHEQASAEVRPSDTGL